MNRQAIHNSGLLTLAVTWLFLFLMPACRTLSDEGENRLVVLEMLERDFRFLEGTDARITFVEPLTDSRCPLDVDCVTAGSTSILMRIDRPGKRTEFTLEGYVSPEGFDAVSEVSAVADGFRVSLLRLDPYPIDSLVVNDLYRARLKVEY